MNSKLHGLVAATHTPFATDGSLNLSIVERQAEFIASVGVATVFVGGSTGESASLALQERLELTERWSEVLKGTSTKLVVHVGTNCLNDACDLARSAQTHGAAAIAALSPSYFKPRSLDDLVECCALIASSAPALPFYFYDIPALTGVSFSMPDFLHVASTRIPSLAGIKYTNSDLMAYRFCLDVQDGRYDIPWGVDEALLAALAVGATGAVGSSYNFAAPVYQRLIRAFEAGDLASARLEQRRSIELIRLLARYGYMAAAKATMGFIGVEVGEPRLPSSRLATGQASKLRGDLESIGYFDWGLR